MSTANSESATSAGRSRHVAESDDATPSTRPARWFTTCSSRGQSIYWTDLLLTLVVVLLDGGDLPSLAAVFRPAVDQFHDLRVRAVSGRQLRTRNCAHAACGEMLGFRVGWNLLCGIPFVMPSHFYENHIDHHNSHHYGTIRDGEYLPLGAGPLRDIFWFFAQVPFLPAYIALRLLLSPLTFVHPQAAHLGARAHVELRDQLSPSAHDSRSAPRKRGLRWNSPARCVGRDVRGRARGTLSLDAAGAVVLPGHVRHAAQLHSQPGGASLSRTPAAQMTHAEQLTDSITITGHWFWTELFFPLGLALSRAAPPVPRHSLSQPGPGPSPLDGEAAGRLAVSRRRCFPATGQPLRQLWSNIRAVVPERRSRLPRPEAGHGSSPSASAASAASRRLGRVRRATSSASESISARLSPCCRLRR